MEAKSESIERVNYLRKLLKETRRAIKDAEQNKVGGNFTEKLRSDENSLLIELDNLASESV